MIDRGTVVKRGLEPTAWMGGGFFIALLLAAVVFARAPPDNDSVRIALRVTARWSFLLFWMAYSGSAIATLLGPAFASLARRGREFGLAFAAAHLVHVGLIVLLYRILDHDPLPQGLAIFFGIGIFWTYLLAFFSFGGLSTVLGPRLWHMLRFLGSNYILLAFAKDFLPPVLFHGTAVQHFRGAIGYVPFATLCIAGPLLRLLAATRRPQRGTA